MALRATLLSVQTHSTAPEQSGERRRSTVQRQSAELASHVPNYREMPRSPLQHRE